MRPFFVFHRKKPVENLFAAMKRYEIHQKVFLGLAACQNAGISVR